MTVRSLRHGMPDLPPPLFEIELLVRGTLFVVAGAALPFDRCVVLVFGHARRNRLRLVLHHAHVLVSRSGTVADFTLHAVLDIHLCVGLQRMTLETLGRVSRG